MHTADHIMANERIHEETNSWQAWLVCLTAGLFFFYEFIQMNLPNAISAPLMQAFSLDAGQLGALSANYFYANLIFLFPAGLLLDRFSTRKIILISLSICILGTFLFALSTNAYLAGLFRFLTGIGSGFCFLSCIRLASRWFPAHRMALVSGLIVTMAMLGGSVAQFMTKLSDMFGWRHAMILDGILGVVILLLISVFVKDFPPNTSTIAQTKVAMESLGFFENIRRAYFNLQNWLCGIYTCLMNLPVAVLGALWGSLYLEQVFHYSSTQAALITSMIFIGTVVGSPFAGWFSDWLGYRKLPMLLGTLCTMIISAAIVFGSHHSIDSLILLFLGLGFFSSTQIVSYPMVAESNNRLITASSVSVVSFSVISGYAIFQPLFGWLMDLHWDHLRINNEPIYTSSDFHIALIILPIAFMVSLLAIFFMKETHCRPSEKY